MNFAELLEEFFARGTDYLEEDAAGLARAERWINQAYKEILNAQPWPFLEAFRVGDEGAGTAWVPDLKFVLLVSDLDPVGSDAALPGKVLKRRTWQEIARSGEDSNSLGTPESYYVDNQTVVAFPRGGTIRVDYIRRVDNLQTDQVPVFGEEYHDLIVDRAMIKAYKDSDNFEAAAALREEYNAGLVAMAEDYMHPSSDVTYIEVHPYDG